MDIVTLGGHPEIRGVLNGYCRALFGLILIKVLINQPCLISVSEARHGK